MGTHCEDCNGTGRYVGFTESRTCPTCKGVNWIDITVEVSPGDPIVLQGGPVSGEFVSSDHGTFAGGPVNLSCGYGTFSSNPPKEIEFAITSDDVEKAAASAIRVQARNWGKTERVHAEQLEFSQAAARTSRAREQVTVLANSLYANGSVTVSDEHGNDCEITASDLFAVLDPPKSEPVIKNKIAAALESGELYMFDDGHLYDSAAGRRITGEWDLEEARREDESLRDQYGLKPEPKRAQDLPREYKITAEPCELVREPGAWVFRRINGRAGIAFPDGDPWDEPPESDGTQPVPDSPARVALLADLDPPGAGE